MSKQITFFWDRRQAAGHTYEFGIEDGARIYRVSVFSRKPLEGKLVQRRNLPKENKGDLQPEIDKINSAIRRGQGGGVVVVIYEENRNRFLWTSPVASQPDTAFGSVGILRPGDPSLNLEALKASNGVLPFPTGAHALIPVDLEAEMRLRSFQGQLRYLPADLETLVLHALRDPSLELRIGLLEAIVAPRVGIAHYFEPRYKRWLNRPVLIWPVAAIVLGLMLFINSVFLYLVLRSANSSIVVPFIGRTEQAKETNPTPEQKIFAIVQTVRGKGSNPHFAALSQGHFAKIQKEGDLSKILTSGGGDSALVVRGLIKLEALRLDKADAYGLFGDLNNYTEVNNFYKGRHLDATSRDMLAALSCVAFGSPGLPQTQLAPTLPFADVGQDCTSFQLEKATPGLDRLLKLVEKN